MVEKGRLIGKSFHASRKFLEGAFISMLIDGKDKPTFVEIWDIKTFKKASDTKKSNNGALSANLLISKTINC